MLIAVLLTASPDCERQRALWQPLGFEPPCVLMVGKPKARFTAARQWNIDDDDAAKCAVSAASVQLEGGTEGADGVANDWLQCVFRWPQFDALWIGAHFASQAAGGGHSHLWLDALRSSKRHEPDRKRARFLMERTLGPPELVADAMSDEVLGGGTSGVLAALDSPFFDDDTKINLALRHLGTSPAAWVPRREIPCDEEALVARGVLTALVRCGHLQLVSETWRDLSSCARERLSAPEGRPAAADGGTADGGPRTWLALALATTGHLEEARRIPLEAMPSAAAGQFAWMLVQAVVHGRRTLDAERAAALFATLRGFPVEALPVAMAFLAPRDELVRQQLSTALEPQHRNLPVPAGGSTRAWRQRDAHHRALAGMKAALTGTPDGGALRPGAAR